MGLSFFPRTDAGQFVINLKAPTGTRIELTNEYVNRVEDIVRQVVPADELQTVVSNIGVMPDLSSLFTPNSGMHTAFVQVGLKQDHRVNSYTYMAIVQGSHRARTPGAAHVLPVGRLGGRRAQSRRAQRPSTCRSAAPT